MKSLVTRLMIVFSVLATSWSVYAQFAPPPQAPPPTDRAKSDAGEASRALAEPKPKERQEIPRRFPSDNESNSGEFPPLPPDPYERDRPKLPSLEEELISHGGSHLYLPEGDQGFALAHDENNKHKPLRLPEDWQEPQPPVTGSAKFLGNDPILPNPNLTWPGSEGYAWDPRFVMHGRYFMFGMALEQNNQRQDGLGHQLLLDLDLRLTGTERFHMQFRPIGRENTGGSFYQLNDPQGYIDNSHAEPDRYWFEFELHSILGAFVDPNLALDYHFTAGRVPFTLHNDLLINDEFHAVAINKNNINVWNLSNLNVQVYHAFNDVDAFDNGDGNLSVLNLFIDYRRVFYESSYAYLTHDFDSSRDTHYFALSRTQLIGNYTVAGRALFKHGDSGGTGSGQLFTLEGNMTRLYDNKPLGVEKAVFFTNAFLATRGWNSIARANFNRLRTAFEVNPLVRISSGNTLSNNWGASAGVQLFRHHEDESWVPEIAVEQPEGEFVYGVGLRYLRKISCRSFIEVLGLYNESSDDRFDRLGVFGTYSILF